MLLRNIKIFMLYLAGILLLGHNITPHHHLAELFGEHTASDNTAHFEDHHQDNNEDHHHDNPKEDKSTHSEFVHHSHPFGTSEIKFLAKSEIKQVKIFNLFMRSAYFTFRTLRLPPKIIPPPDVAEIYHNYSSASFSLRGPPARA